MKIAIDLTKITDKITGMEKFAMMISYQLIKQTDDDFILVFHNKIHPFFKEFENKKNVEFVIINEKNSMKLILFKVAQTMNKIKADKYLFLAEPVPIFFFKKNTIGTIHDLVCWDHPETMLFKYRLYYRLSLRLTSLKCQKLITVSSFSKKRIVEKLKHKEENVYIVNNGISETFYFNNYQTDVLDNIKQKYHLPDHFILCLSTIEPRKNMSLLVKACCELWNNNAIDIPLVIAGNSGWKNDDINNISNNKIVLTGYVDEEDLSGLYHLADLFVFPSKYEGFGMTPLEAMASNTVVLSSNGPCMPEILEDAAIYFENNNLEDLKTKLVKTLNIDNNIYKEKGKQQALKYRWEQQAKKVINLLHEKN